MNRWLVIALVCVGIVGAYFLYSYVSQNGISARNDVRVETASVREETDAYSIDVKYPQFGIPATDADIKEKVNAAVAEFKSLPANPPESATPKNEFTGTFEDAYIGPDVVSVKLVLSQYTGGAHPMTIFTGLNYDRASGRQLLQDDAFQMIGMTAGDVSTKATAELKEKLGEAFFPEGVNSNPENFSSFTISADTVTFIFQPYQVAPYAAGPQEVFFTRVD